jgi:hypothetical protein
MGDQFFNSFKVVEEWKIDISSLQVEESKKLDWV